MLRCCLLFGIILSACTSGSSPSGITAESLTCPPDSTLTYDNFGATFMADNCLSCHTTKEQPHLTSVAAIRSHTKKIISEAVTSTSMPQDASMSDDERALLGEWLTCGAP